MTSIDTMFLIYQENRAILKGKRRKLAQQREVLENLARSIGVTPPTFAPGCAGCAGCAAVYGLGSGVLGTVTGIILLAIGYLTSVEYMPVSAMMLAVGIYTLMAFGLGSLLQTYLGMRYPAYIKRRYKQLIAEGAIVEGTITSIEEEIVKIVHYQFDVPARRETCEGQYHLYTQTPLIPGQKLTILYLNRCIHVPL